MTSGIWLAVVISSALGGNARAIADCTSFPVPGDLAYVLAMTQDRLGDYWLGTTQGIRRFDGERWEDPGAPPWLLADSVTSVVESPEGTLWFGSLVSGVTRRDTVTDCRHQPRRSR